MPSPKITEQPLVTIGMCVFNCDRFLVKALDSLLSQEYKNFELIISDNASEDRTQEICLEYQARDPRIQYSRNETNMGAIFNGVKVINLARGKYFMFGSDHDLWHPSFITKRLEVIEDRNGASSTLITSQLPMENWHEHIGNPTIADAILGLLIHNAHRINLKGGSMRKK